MRPMFESMLQGDIDKFDQFAVTLSKNTKNK